LVKKLARLQPFKILSNSPKEGAPISAAKARGNEDMLLPELQALRMATRFAYVLDTRNCEDNPLKRTVSKSILNKSI